MGTRAVALLSNVSIRFHETFVIVKLLNGLTFSHVLLLCCQCYE